jgi:hypothetical protein
MSAREKPILMSAPMVRALLAGTKTMTRRPMRVQPRVIPDWACSGVAGLEFDWGRGDVSTYADRPETLASYADDFAARCPYGQPGDRLWVRETWALAHPDYHTEAEGLRLGRPAKDGRWPFYAATDTDVDMEGARWRPSIHMPRWASRITLEVTEVRVQRACEISESDARAEGVTSAIACSALPGGSGSVAGLVAVGCGHLARANTQNWTPRDCFRVLFCALYGPDAWDKWVWAVSFEVVR